MNYRLTILNCVLSCIDTNKFPVIFSSVNSCFEIKVPMKYFCLALFYLQIKWNNSGFEWFKGKPFNSLYFLLAATQNRKKGNEFKCEILGQFLYCYPLPVIFYQLPVTSILDLPFKGLGN